MNVNYFKEIYTHYCKIRTEPHFIDIYLDVVKTILKIDEDSELYHFPTIINTEGKIVIHPFAIRKAKEWNLKKFIDLANRLGNEYEVEIISPAGFIYKDTIETIKNSDVSLSTTANIKELISKIKECSLFISNDSGPTYIANFLGKPTYTIYGPTNPAYSLPFGKNHRFIQKKISCSADGNKVCFTQGGIHCPSFECMHLISLEEVSDDVKSFLRTLKIKKKKINLG